jgi:hypothetical protein
VIVARLIASFLFVWLVIWGAGLWLSDATRKDLREVTYQGSKALACTVISLILVVGIIIAF